MKYFLLTDSLVYNQDEKLNPNMYQTLYASFLDSQVFQLS